MSDAAGASVCRTLRLRHFRNFEDLELEFPPEGAVIVGDNGSGKTNLLEALYYLEIFRSFRGANDARLVRFGADAFFARGSFEIDDETTEVTAAYERRTRRKRVTVDGAEPERLGDAIGRVGAVVFSPSDIALVAGSPGERRRFLDIVLALNVHGYLDALQQYRRILRQRNSLLREGAPPAALAAWDEGLVRTGARVSAARARWVSAHADGFARRYEAIGGGGRALLRYEPSIPLDEPVGGVDEAAAAEAFETELARTGTRERDRGVTLTGPHRDDLRILLETGEGGPIDLRAYGSGGQQRTAAIALRMVEAETVRAARRRHPMVLLDDIFAELDPGRAQRLLESLEAEEPGQVVITAPKASDLEMRRGRLPHWRISRGTIQA